MKKYLLSSMLLLGLVCSAQASAEEASAFTPSLPANQVLKVAETTEATMSPATSAEDNSHWYLVTQTRVQTGTPTATPMYDNGVGNTLYRADVDVTPASLNGKLLDLNTKYLARFVQATDSTYYIQFATGNFIQNTLTTGDYTGAGQYVFYNINGTDGHFAWNLVGDGTKYGSIVDNNGAGYTMAFWETGEVTWTDGNNDWAIYAVSFEDATFSKVTFSTTDQQEGDAFSVSANGTEIESGADVANGSTIKVTAKAGEGRAVGSVTVGGEEVTLSKNAYSFTLENDVDITATFIQMPTINYSLTDAAGNVYTGSYNAVFNGDDTENPTFTGAEGATIVKTCTEESGVYTLTGTITFQFPVSSETVQNATAIQSQTGSSLWYANSSDEVIADNSANYAATYETQQNYNWYIYPCFTDGAFSFKIYNIGAQKWIPAAASTSKSTATVLTAEETEAGQFPFLKVVSGNGFASDLTSRNYLCIESDGAGQYVYLRNMKTNSKNTGANLSFPDPVSISDDPEPDPEPGTDISGQWYEATTGWYYSSDWEEVSVSNNPVTVTVSGTTATFANLLGESDNNLNATISGNTLTFAKGQTAYYGGYDWEFGGEDADGAECDLTGTISEDGNTITISGFNIWYGGYSYMWSMETVLTREEVEPEPEPAADINGEWYEKSTGMYYGSGWEDLSINNNPVTVTVDGTTATFANILGDSDNNLVATISGNTLTFAKGQTVYYGGYDWEFGGEDADGAECDVTGTISENGDSIIINGINIWYSGYSYFWNMQTVLTREKGEEAVTETFPGYVCYLTENGYSEYISTDISATLTKSTLEDKTTYSIDNYGTSGYALPAALTFTVEDGAISAFSGLYYGGYAYYLTSDVDDIYFEAEGSVFDETNGYLSFPYWYYTSYNNENYDEQGTFFFVWGDYDPTGIKDVNAAATRDGKYIEKGNIVILRNGKKYNAAGMIIK